MIAMSLMNNKHDFEEAEYILPYYLHCLTEFSKTLFGQVFMSSTKAFINLQDNLNDCY